MIRRGRGGLAGESARKRNHSSQSCLVSSALPLHGVAKHMFPYWLLFWLARAFTNDMPHKQTLPTQESARQGTQPACNRTDASAGSSWGHVPHLPAKTKNCDWFAPNNNLRRKTHLEHAGLWGRLYDVG